MAMPWSRGKQIAAALRGQGEFPAGYTGSRTVGELRSLFDACFRIQREACEAAGRHIPMVVENVRGAIPWVGRSAWNYGSFHLWGDVPALMPFARGIKNGELGGGSWFGVSATNTVLGMNPDGRRIAHGVKAIAECLKWGGCNGKVFSERPTGTWFGDYQSHKDKLERLKHGGDWFNPQARANGSIARFGSRSEARKAASAQIAKIPFPLASHIARVYKPLASDPGSDYTKRQ